VAEDLISPVSKLERSNKPWNSTENPRGNPAENQKSSSNSKGDEEGPAYSFSETLASLLEEPKE
jgi:hypothetical protein